MPCVLTLAEVRLVLRHMRGVDRLVAGLLYGSGLRLLEALQLRVKDVDFQRCEIMVRRGKGAKDRITMLAKGFAALASLVRRGGTAISSIHVADAKKLEVTGVTGINFELAPSTKALDRVANALVTKRIVAPPITRITLDEVPGVFGGTSKQAADGKTVITL